MDLSQFTRSSCRRPALTAVAAQRRSTAARLGCAGAVALLLAAGAVLVYATGGTKQPWLHMLYVPVLLAGWGFGPVGGIAAGVAAGLLVGPLMPLDVAVGEAQPTVNWLYRLGFFTLMGGLGGALNGLLRAQLRDAHRARRRFAALVTHAPDVIVECDDGGVVRYVSPSATAVLGHAECDLLGKPLDGLVHPDDRAGLAALLPATDACARQPTVAAELRLRHTDGSWRHLETTASDLRADPDVGATVLNGSDVTQRRALEAKLRHQAAHDPATGLANRQRFMDAVQHALAHDASDRRPAVLLINLDGLKTINATYGPETGDHLIAALAQRLTARVRPQDLLARYSGTEFALLCPDLADAATATAVAERLLDSVREPFLLVTGEVYLQASIGVAVAAGDATEPAALVSDAHTALRHTKHAGGNRQALFQPAWRAPARAALRTEHALHAVLDRGELEVYYQPIVALDTARPVGFEALLRWQHPQLGTVAPSDFIPIAEQTGAIIPIGRWVLTQACRQLAAWRRQPGGAHLGIAVNLSPLQLANAALPDQVRQALASPGIPPGALTLELTETALLDDPDEAIAALYALKNLGVRIAVDDFGTGYSSLGHLHQLPVDILKIDRLFTRPLGSDHAAESIVGAVIGLAHTLDLDTIAEGVETDDQARSLARLGCQHAQGYLYARPQPADHIGALLAHTPA